MLNLLMRDKVLDDEALLNIDDKSDSQKTAILNKKSELENALSIGDFEQVMFLSLDVDLLQGRSIF